MYSIIKKGTLRDIIGWGYSQPDHISNLPISDVIKGIFSKKFRENLCKELQQKTEATQSEAYDAECKANNYASTKLLESIVLYCPENHLIRIKLYCGNSSDGYLEEVLREQIFVASKEGTAYTRETGCMTIDPDHFDRDHKRIAAWIFKSRLLSGSPIMFFDYHAKLLIE